MSDLPIRPIRKYLGVVERLPDSPDEALKRLIESYEGVEMDDTDEFCERVVQDIEVVLRHYTILGKLADVEWDIRARMDDDELIVFYTPVALLHTELEFVDLDDDLVLVRNPVTNATFTAGGSIEAKARAAALATYHPDWLVPE